ncbi:S-layer homology domain-containing protein [Paenibacillus sp. HB172176]|uniref:S-layer homology domain-containing protein n=1 Tax=Paenibacillus sp. HB172176 TaxID=2493690 RepID=UPI001439BC61|nr:S-layer homology domain-containing protein [Paenibacillus sp. HB172176]
MARKFWILILSLLLLYTGLFSAVVAAEGNPFISLKTASSSVKKGDTFQVTVEGNDLKNLYGIDVRVAYDADRLKVVQTVQHVEDVFPVLINDRNPLILAHSLIGEVPGISGDKLLFTITFKAISEGEAHVSLTRITQIVREDEQLVSYDSTLDDSLSVQVASGGADPSPSPSIVPSATPSPTPSVAPSATPSPTPSVAPSATPSPTSSATPKPTPLPSSAIKVEAEADDSGVAAVAIQAEELLGAIEAATDKQVLIEVKPGEGTKEVQVQIGVEQIRMAGDKELKAIRVDTGFATVTINPKLLKNGTHTASANLELSVAALDSSRLSEELREQLGEGAVVYDFKLSVDGKLMESFHGNEITVGIPYTLKPGENPHTIVIYYVTDDGKLEVVKNSKYNTASGQAEFKPKHFSPYAAAYADVTFMDIAHVDWAKDAIEGMAARTMIEGVGEGKFDPDGSVTRAQFITMLMNAFDLNDPAAVTKFADVLPATWYYTPVASAEQLGIVEGKSESFFGIDDPVSRQDMAVMLFRAMKVLNLQLEGKAEQAVFADQSSISPYAVQAVRSMQEAGIIQGVGEGKFAPEAQATRAQAAVIIYRLLGNNV